MNSYFGNFIAILTFMLTIMAIFYGSNFILKRHILPISIASFYIGVISGSFFEYIIKDFPFPPVFEIVGLFGCFLVILTGLMWTYFPAKFFLTLDVRYRLYGIEGHSKRCDITAKKKYIVFIFNLFGINFPKTDSFDENFKHFHVKKERRRGKKNYK